MGTDLGGGQPLFRRWAQAVLGHPWLCLAVIGLLSVVLLPAAASVQVDNTFPAWLPTGDPEAERYAQFRERFGGDTFIMVVTADMNLGDQELRRELFEMQQELGRIPGVVATHGPLVPGDLLERARGDLEVNLRTTAAAAAMAPDDAELAVLEAATNASAAFLLFDAAGERVTEHWRVAQRASLRALRLLEPDVATLLDPPRSSTPPERTIAVIESVASSDQLLAALYWWATARAGELELRPQDPGLLAGLGHLDAVMAWLADQAPLPDPSGPHLYLAVRALGGGVALGGDADKAQEHFQAAQRVAPGALLPVVLRARHLAPTLANVGAQASFEEMQAAQQRAWGAFTTPLLELLAEPEVVAASQAQRLADAVARDRAREMLSDPEEFGLLEPDGAVLDVPPLPPGQRIALVEDVPGRFLVSEDGRRAAFSLIPEPDLDPVSRTALMARVEEELTRHGRERFFLVGPEVVTHALDQGSRQSSARLFPLVLVAMALVLLVSMRSLQVVVAILLTAGMAAGWATGLLVLTGHAMNVVVSVVPAILVVLTTAYGMHLVNRFLQEPLGPEGRTPEARRGAWQSAIQHTIGPCFLASLTTAAGFASLGTSGLPPVRHMGLLASVGVVISFLLTFSLLPVLLAASRWLWPRGASAAAVVGPGLSQRFTAVVARLAVPISALAVLAVAVSVWGITLLTFDSHVLSFFSGSHPLPRAYAEVEPNLFGLTPFELWVEGDQDTLLSEEALSALEGYLDTIEQRDEITRVISPLAVARASGLSPRACSVLLQAADSELGASPGASSYARLEGERLSLRFTLACRAQSSHRATKLAGYVRAQLPVLPQGITMYLSGAAPLLQRLEVLLLQTQITSFSLALAVVTLILAAAYRSLRLVVISLIPNLVPVVFTLGVMGLTGIPLSTATVTVAGIALGLVVDDTIHVLHHYHLMRQASRTPGESVCEALHVVGRPVVTTTVAVAAGFGLFGFAEFMPIHYFGLLIALSCLAALVCDLVVLPALLLLRKV